MENHYLKCEAAICTGDPNPNYKNEVVWCPGEELCKKGPYKKFQKKQIDINDCFKKGSFKNVDERYTAKELENRSI